ncbi:hypothetical protein M408DRAFT_293276 [Serendipita vermifera MAFF 305830]|uniref:Uncharacterized protein n=1 Tax=Serendipita vermifera MAFF 305830 TaxID=933852 RepID=A0A0C3AC06_SERVB|nr:hypothetical protein M408DRAFT_293276 [Serendipita vermifera MAFF 305830]
MEASVHSKEMTRAHSAEYVLPNTVKSWVDGLSSSASSVAVTTALFAGVMASFAQLVATVENTSAAWEALRFFTFASIITNLVAAMCAMYAMWMYAELPGKAQRLLLDPDSWPSRMARGEPLSHDLLMNEYNLLEAFGIYKSHMTIISGVFLWAMGGVTTFFTTFAIYVWLTQSIAVAGSLTIFVAGGVFGFLYPIVREIPASIAQGWKEGWNEVENGKTDA